MNWALHDIVDTVTRDRPLGFLVRLEAFYQHYALFALLEGKAPRPRDVWWPAVVASDPEFTAFMVCDAGVIVPDAKEITM